MTKTGQGTLAIVATIFMTGALGTSAQAQTFKVLHTFGGPGDGGIPYGGVVRDEAGNLYGTASTGGIASANCVAGCGVVFKLDKTGNETVLYSFLGGADGGGPFAGLLRDSAGNLYGTTQIGGAGDCGYGCGVVFKLDTAGNETVLYTFLGATSGDGSEPVGVLVRDSKGNLYGTTAAGGLGGGTVFKLDTAGKETVYSFGKDGQKQFNLGEQPLAGVIRDAEGNLYGTTWGGTNSPNPPLGVGVVFKLTENELANPKGEGTILHTFTGFTGTVADGAFPYYGSLIRDSAGNLYGTTYLGGIAGDCVNGAGCGTVFKVDATGAETILYSFTGGADGGYPAAGLIRDSAGNLYGTGILGGTSNVGVVFKLDASGTLTVLHNFTGGADGGTPLGDLVRDASGNLYGTTSAGGGCGQCGVVFKIKP